MDEKTVQSAMTIILNAGDARVACKKALDAIAKSDFESAETYMKEAHQKITEAHKVQTDAIQEETRGEKMTIYSEINIAKQMIRIFKSYEERLEKLEKTLG